MGLGCNRRRNCLLLFCVAAVRTAAESSGMNEDLATVKRAGLIFLPLAAIAAAAFFVLFHIQDDAARTVTEATEARILDQARLIVFSSLAAGAADVRYLAEQPLLNEWLDDPESRLARERIAGDYLAFAAVHAAYDRIQLVDLGGKELIRVEWAAGAPQIAEDTSLADRIDAAYVADTLKRARGELYQSSFELTSESGVGGAESKPAIRFASPFFDRKGAVRGLVAITYLGDPMIERLRGLGSDRLSMLNGAGNWLIGPDRSMEWPAIAPGSPVPSLARQNPEAWQRIRSGGSAGRFYLAGNLYSYVRLFPPASRGGAQPEAGAGEDATVLLSQLPAALLRTDTAELRRTRLLGAASFMILLGAISVAAARQWAARRRHELAIRRSEARFRNLLELAPDAVAITDDRGAVVLTNSAAESLFARSRDDIVGRLIDRFVPGLWQDAQIPERLAGAPDKIHGTRVETTASRAGGGQFPAAVTIAPVATDEGTLVYCDIRDISIVKENERRISQLAEDLRLRNAELEAANRELESFSYSVSHDLRAPLRAIDGFSQALAEDAGDRLDAVSRGHLARIRKAAQRMGHLIDDLIRLARVTRSEIAVQTVDLTAMVDEVARGLKESAPQRSVNFRIEPGLVVTGDPQLIRVAVENLLDNAWKFTAQRPHADIEFGRRALDGEPAYFVRDNGAGFDMTYVGKLFGPFQRLHDANKFPGTGIGLATVQRIISKHGGRVWAEGRPEAGATFYFTLAA
jgi:PAS domain S-box-containing protein